MLGSSGGDGLFGRMREQRVQRGRPCWEGGGGDRRGVEQGVLSKVGGSRTAQVSEATPSAGYLRHRCMLPPHGHRCRASSSTKQRHVNHRNATPPLRHAHHAVGRQCTLYSHPSSPRLPKKSSQPSFFGLQSSSVCCVCVMKTGFQLTLRASTT